MSFLLVLAKPHNSELKLSLVIIFTALRSPSEITGNPVSIASIPNASNFFAMFSFCSGESETPGVCSPSLNVVSNILIFNVHSFVMQQFQFVLFLKFQTFYLILQMLQSDVVLMSFQP